MKYEELTTLVNSDRHLGSDYYALLINHRDEILTQVDKFSQAIVAKDLNIPQPKLSVILNILKLLPLSTSANYIDDRLKF